MEQLIKYSDFQQITDITKNVMRIPMTVQQINESSIPQFTIVNYDEFKAAIERIVESINLAHVEINERNVSTYENEASEINKLIKQLKSDAKEYVNAFTATLLGTKGKNKQIGQIKEISDILQEKYDEIHKLTVAYRMAKRIDKENAIDINDVSDVSYVSITLNCPVNKIDELKEFCAKNSIEIMKGAN